MIKLAVHMFLKLLPSARLVAQQYPPTMNAVMPMRWGGGKRRSGKGAIGLAF